MNWTGESLSLTGPDQMPAAGSYAAGKAPPTSCGDMAVWVVESNDSAVTGSLDYQGESGGVTMTWDVPVSGANSYSGTPSGSYVMTRVDGQKVGANPGVVYRIDKSKSVPPPPSAPPASQSDSADTGPEDHSNAAHVPTAGGKPSSISVKRWLIDLAWEAVDNTEWDDLILEITENRHGDQHGAPCPRTLLKIDDIPQSGGTCPTNHAAKLQARIKLWALKLTTEKGMEAAAATSYAATNDRLNPIWNDFHSWCGDFATWPFWKGWVLKKKPEDKVTKAELASFLNREAVSGQPWASGKNLSMLEAYARGMMVKDYQDAVDGKNGVKMKKGPGKLMAWHNMGDGYIPTPGDLWMSNRPGGGHVGFVVSFNSTSVSKNDKKPAYEITTLDGKSFDDGWLKSLGAGNTLGIAVGAQGVVHNSRRTDDVIIVNPGTEKEQKIPNFKGIIDTSKLREALGYR